jgi:phosphoribosylamine--glycine ligase
MEETLDKVLNPTIQEMAARGTPFVGLLYAGLALTSRGTKVIEFNARFGDPETQVLLPRLKTPLAQLLFAAATKNLENFGDLEWSDDSAVTVVLASAGYPADPKIGEAITGIQTNSNSYVFHAGTEMHNGVLHSSGGRVLTVTGLGSDLTQARDAAYRTISRISLPGSHYRSDIALNASVAEKGN